MTRFIKWLFIGFFVTGMLLGILAGNSLEDFSNVPQPPPLTHDQLKRVKTFIKLNNPAKLQSGQVANSQISQQDLNHLLNYLSQKSPQRLLNRLHANVIFDHQRALLQTSMRLPSNPVDAYINVSISLRNINTASKSSIKIESIQVGPYILPDVVTRFVTNYMHKQLVLKAPEYALVLQSIQNISFKKHGVSVKYIWDRQVAEQIKEKLSSRVISDEFKQAPIAHANHLAKISRKLSQRPDFNDLLTPMFSYALLRSKQHNPINENRAV